MEDHFVSQINKTKSLRKKDNLIRINLLFSQPRNQSLLSKDLFSSIEEWCPENKISDPDLLIAIVGLLLLDLVSKCSCVCMG